MHRLSQAGILTQKLSYQPLNEKEYRQSSLALGYSKTKRRPISFTLFVENYGLKYVGKEHAKHLVTTLNGHFIILQYWEVT